jgi:hypothetical protein
MSDLERRQAESDLAARDNEIRHLGLMLLALTKPADYVHCCNTIGNAWGHSPFCSNVPPFMHPDDRK